MRHTFTLANGVEIPAVGFGTYKAAADNDEAIAVALGKFDIDILE